MRFKWGCLEGQAISVSDTVVKNPMTSHERRKEQHINIHDKKHCSNFLFLRGDGWHPINRCIPATSFCLYLSQDLDLQRHMSWLFCVQGVKMIDDCMFCRCRGLSCVQGVTMIDDCLFCRCRGHSCVQGVLLG